METLKLSVTDNIQVTARKHSGVMLFDTNNIAKGYNTNRKTIYESFRSHKEEFKNGVHFITSPFYSRKSGINALKRPHYYFTKQGVIRFGFFIKSDTAKLFRDCLESMVMNEDKQNGLFTPGAYQERNDDTKLLQGGETITRAILIKPLDKIVYDNKSYYSQDYLNWFQKLIRDIILIDSRDLRVSIMQNLEKGGAL